MRGFHLSAAERRAAARWAADTSWSEQEKYLEDKGYMECVRDILEHPVFQSMENFIQHGTTSCKAHCLQVSYLSYHICRRFGWDYRKAARAGLLHDLFLYDWHTHARETGNHFHGFTHPRAALNNARKYFSLMSVVYADKLCSVTETALLIRGWFAGRFLLRGA